MPSTEVMKGKIDLMNKAKLQMTSTVEKMNELKEAIPKAFETTKTSYLGEIDKRV